MLLLGPGEAGKSTVLKQLKCIYKGGIPLAEQRVSHDFLALRLVTISIICFRVVDDIVKLSMLSLTQVSFMLIQQCIRPLVTFA